MMLYVILKYLLVSLIKEIEEGRNALDTKAEVRVDVDKQLDRLGDKRQKDRDERDKLFKAKDDVKDEYYAKMILYEKQQQLIPHLRSQTHAASLWDEPPMLIPHMRSPGAHRLPRRASRR